MSLVELIEPVDLCLADGSLNPRAIGYTRRPLHRTHLRGWGRNKRWEYWGVITPSHIFALTIADLDYLAGHQLYVYDRATHRERAITRPDFGVALADAPPVHARASARGLELAFDDIDDGTRLRASARGIELELFVPTSGDSLGVVVPWSARRFQYTVKSVARPARGSVVIDGARIAIDHAWAVLDRGRGRWPYRMTWNWGAGSGIVDGTRIGLQLGGKWTAGTGSTECAVIVDGRLHYLPDEPTWRYDRRDFTRPWHVRGARVDATLVPFHVRATHANAIVAGTTVHQAYGMWIGWAATDDGARVRLDGLVGWAEEAINRW